MEDVMSDAETTQAEQTALADQEAPEAVREDTPEANEQVREGQHEAPEQVREDQREGDEQELGEGGKRALISEREARRAAERELATLRMENTRYQVVTAKGVPVELAEFITGDTEDEMAAKADLLLSRLSSSTTTPKPDRTQGASSGNARPMSNAELFAQQTAGF